MVIRELRQGHLDHLWDKLQKLDECVETRASASVAILAELFPVSLQCLELLPLIHASARLIGKSYCSGPTGESGDHKSS